MGMLVEARLYCDNCEHDIGMISGKLKDVTFALIGAKQDDTVLLCGVCGHDMLDYKEKPMQKSNTNYVGKIVSDDEQKGTAFTKV